jgi:hypothetical protein
MVDPFSAAAAGASLVSGIASAFGGKSGSKAAKKAAEEAARQEKVVTAERIRQLQQEERSLAGQTRARSAGAGAVIGSGSVLQVLAEQASEFARERRIVKQAGASRARAALDQGNAVANQAFYGGLGNLFAGLGQAAGTAYNAGWFTKK